MNVFFLLVIFHFAADFGLQIYGIGPKKYALNKYMIAHVFIISAAFFIPALFYFNFRNVGIATIFVGITHLLVDISKAWVYKKYKISPLDQQFWPILGVDQILHVSAIYIALIFLAGK